MSIDTLEIILTREGNKDQALIGGPVKGQGPVTAEHEAIRARRIVVTDLRGKKASK